MLRETWEAIAEHRKKCTSQTMTSEKEGTNEIAIPTEIEHSPPPEKIYVYSCPFCQKSINTSIASGHVNHRRVCGNAGWSSSADAADNPLFAHMPYLWNLRPEHQRIWAHQKQTQTIQWPRVPPNGMACKVITNDQFQLACLPQLSAWKLSAGKQAWKKSPARGRTPCPWRTT